MLAAIVATNGERQQASAGTGAAQNIAPINKHIATFRIGLFSLVFRLPLIERLLGSGRKTGNVSGWWPVQQSLDRRGSSASLSLGHLLRTHSYSIDYQTSTGPRGLYRSRRDHVADGWTVCPDPANRLVVLDRGCIVLHWCRVDWCGIRHGLVIGNCHRLDISRHEVRHPVSRRRRC